MVLLTVRDVSRQFDAEPLFRNVSFDLRAGERIGFVGPNGAGKTTLLHLLAGFDQPDVGDIERPNAVTVGLLEQRAEFEQGRTLLDEAKAGLAHLYELQDRAHLLAEQLASASGRELGRLQNRYDELQEELHRTDAYAIDHRIDEVLGGLGFTTEEYARDLNSFSGGQQSRILLARLLLQSPEVMLLDEPTNHLDIKTTEWLEGYLATRQNQAIMIVSHDRYFLDRTTNRIVELNGGQLSDYKGNFTAYWEQRAERQKVLERTAEKQQEMIAKTEDFIRRNKYGQKHAQAADRQKKLDRVDRVTTLSDFERPPMRFGDPVRTGDMVLEATGVSNGFGDELLFKDVSLRVERGDRIGILGPNGTGKTTLIRTLLDELPARSGSVRLGTHVHIGYYDQHLESVDANSDAIEAVRPEFKPEMTPGHARSLLARFGVTGDLALQRIGAMSGGERSKVALARLAALDANVLVLDEPTNHLDLWSCEALEDALKSFEGTVLFVSHDRYFLDRVATRVLILEPDHWATHDGNYSAYLAFREGVAQATPPAERTVTPVKGLSSNLQAKPERGRASNGSGKKKRRFPYRKVSEIEAEIAEKESLLEQLEADLADPEVHRDAERMQDTTEAYEETQMEVDTLYEHWEEATELN